MDDTPRRFAPDALPTLSSLQTMQVQLSSMADQKASILMAASFVVFTITIDASHDKLLSLQSLVLGSFTFATAVLTVLAIIPRTTMPKNQPINLMFFGSYTQLAKDDYVERVVGAVADEDAMLRIIAADIYSNGQVLAGKKYRYLGWAYRVFLCGLVISGVVFLLPYLAR